MQKVAFIWDLDGTLLDSYEAILSGIEETFGQFAIPYDKEKVREFILKFSVQVCWSKWQKRESWMRKCSIRCVPRVWLRRMLR